MRNGYTYWSPPQSRKVKMGMRKWQRLKRRNTCKSVFRFLDVGISASHNKQRSAKQINYEVYLIYYILSTYFERIVFIILLNRRPLDALIFIIIKCKHKEAEHELGQNWLVKIYDHQTNLGQIMQNQWCLWFWIFVWSTIGTV